VGDAGDMWEQRQHEGRGDHHYGYDDGGDKPWTEGLPLTSEEAADLARITNTIAESNAWAEGVRRSVVEGLAPALEESYRAGRPLHLNEDIGYSLRNAAYAVGRATFGCGVSYADRQRFLEIAAKAGCKPTDTRPTQGDEAAARVLGAAFVGAQEVSGWFKRTFGDDNQQR
jgi:hypothetical protein